MTASLVDYYALLGVPRDASRADIEHAIKQGIRTWSKQTSRPELEKRQEAERKMQQLREARETLLDDARRQAYDQRLAVAPATARPSGPSDGEDWLELAGNALNINDFRTAARAADEARRVDGQSAEAWGILARANAGLGRVDDAVFEAQRAVQLEPDNLDHRYTLAEIFEQLGDWPNAVQTYQYLAQVDPDSELPQLGTASVYVSAGDYNRAIGLLEQMYASGRDRRLAGDYLAMALTSAAQAVPRVRLADGYAITASDEIGRMRSLLARAAIVTQDPDLQSDIASIQAYVERMAGSEIIWSRIVGPLGAWYLGGSLLLLCCGAFVNELLILAALVILGGGAALVAYARTPRWALNRMTHQGQHLTY